MENEGRIITCVYCGMEYPVGTPTSQNQVLTDHIKICEKHPLRKAEETITLLRKALVGLVGSDNKDELNQMEAVLRAAPMPDKDKADTINAIHALLEVTR